MFLRPGGRPPSVGLSSILAGATRNYPSGSCLIVYYLVKKILLWNFFSLPFLHTHSLFTILQTTNFIAISTALTLIDYYSQRLCHSSALALNGFYTQRLLHSSATKMFRLTPFVVITAIVQIVLAQIPSNVTIPFNVTLEQLGKTYLPYLSENIEFLLSDPNTSDQLARAETNPVTIFMTNKSLPEIAEFFPAWRPDVEWFEQALDMFQYIQVDGVHKSTSFNGTKILQTRFIDSMKRNTSLSVFRSDTEFWVKSGLVAIANITVPVRTFTRA